jgi:hypothetical protein
MKKLIIAITLFYGITQIQASNQSWRDKAYKVSPEWDMSIYNNYYNEKFQDKPLSSYKSLLDYDRDVLKMMNKLMDIAWAKDYNEADPNNNWSKTSVLIQDAENFISNIPTNLASKLAVEIIKLQTSIEIKRTERKMIEAEQAKRDAKHTKHGKDDFKQKAEEAKQTKDEFKDAKQEAKEAIKEAKEDRKDAKQEKKEAKKAAKEGSTQS